MSRAPRIRRDAALAAAVHVAPALSAITPLRRRLLPRLAGIGDPGHVALTFDDGPDLRSTPAFLDVLAAHQVRATFFLLGRMLADAPGLAGEMVAAGHELAVHGWDHRCLVARGPTSTYRDLARTRDLITTLTGRPPRWYRPPYGVLTTPALAAASRLQLTPVLWTSWGRDWESGATAESVLATVQRTLGGGGTVLLHDSDCTSTPGSWRATLGAVPSLIAGLRERGLAVGPLAEHRLVPAASVRDFPALARAGRLGPRRQEERESGSPAR